MAEPHQTGSDVYERNEEEEIQAAMEVPALMSFTHNVNIFVQVQVNLVYLIPNARYS